VGGVAVGGRSGRRTAVIENEGPSYSLELREDKRGTEGAQKIFRSDKIITVVIGVAERSCGGGHTRFR